MIPPNNRRPAVAAPNTTELAVTPAELATEVWKAFMKVVVLACAIVTPEGMFWMAVTVLPLVIMKKEDDVMA